MRHSNLHTHTTFSDGKNTVEENILSAIEKGFVSLGISDHSYTEFDDTYCIPADAVGKYISEIRRLGEVYRDRIEVYLGIELDGFCDRPTDDYDYIIGSCHYVKNAYGYFSVDHCIEVQEMTLERYYDSDPLKYAEAYFETIAELTAKNKPDIIGHFDLASKFGKMPEDNPKYRRFAIDSLEACLAVTPIIEVNNGAISRGIRDVPYPAPFLLPEIKRLGGKLILSSDSHKKENLDFNFDSMVEMLKEFGFESIMMLKNNAFEEIGI